MLDGLTMKLPSVLSSWKGHKPVRFTPALRNVTNSPTTSSIRAASVTRFTTSSGIFGIRLKKSITIKGVDLFTIKGETLFSIKGGLAYLKNPGENPTKPEYPPQSPIYIYINI
jgi:hypothetical protein